MNFRIYASSMSVKWKVKFVCMSVYSKELIIADAEFSFFSIERIIFLFIKKSKF